MNRYDALDEIQRVERERRKVPLSSYEHREFTEELSELYKIAYPGNQGDDDESRNGLGSLNRFNERR